MNFKKWWWKKKCKILLQRDVSPYFQFLRSKEGRWVGKKKERRERKPKTILLNILFWRKVTWEQFSCTKSRKNILKQNIYIFSRDRMVRSQLLRFSRTLTRLDTFMTKGANSDTGHLMNFIRRAQESNSSAKVTLNASKCWPLPYVTVHFMPTWPSPDIQIFGQKSF